MQHLSYPEQVFSPPGAAARSSPARESAPACSDEAATAADPSPGPTASRSAETVLPSVTSKAARHHGGRASGHAPHWRGSSPHHRPTHRVPPWWPSPQTTDSSRSIPSQSKQAQVVHDKISPLHRTHAPVSSLPSPQSPCPANKPVANWGGNHIQ